MKNNKGFTPIAIVLVIIAVLAVGGIAYYVGKSSTPAPQNNVNDSSNNFPPVSQNQNLQQLAPTSISKSQVYENQYMKVTIPSGWNLTEATRTIQDKNYDKNTDQTTLIGAPRIEKTGAVNITKGDYILYINTQASQASGIMGGRFNEISGGAPSADAVVTDPPSPACGDSETHLALLDHPRVDLYVSSQDNKDKPWCNVPTNGKTVWYFSYVTDNNGSYFNYYKEGSGTGYVITMAYNSKIVNNFPVKGSAILNSMLDEMTAIVKSLEIK